MKKMFSLAILALALSAGAVHAAVFVQVGPPPRPRHMIVARPGPGYVWVPGYYTWARGRYVWAPGYWTMPPRPRAVWVPGYWTPRHGGYVWISGYWR